MNSDRIGRAVVAGAILISCARTTSAQSTTAMSVTPSGSVGDGVCGSAVTSTNGRFVAFESAADNLVVGDTNTAWDIFVRDRETGITELASVDSNGVQGNFGSYDPAISGDGRFVAFRSFATNLVFSDTNGYHDIFVHDRKTGQTDLVSVDSTGAQANNNSFDPSISADGRFVAFESDATNLVNSDVNGFRDVFVRDRQNGTTEIVSVDSTGVQGNGDSIRPTISADGRYVVFSSVATNLVTGDTNLASDVFLHDRQTGTTVLLSVSTAGKLGDAASDEPAMSPDGRFVVFRSSATNLTTNDTNFRADIFLRDVQAATTEIVSLDSSGNQGNDHSFQPSVSADGRWVAFDSNATNLVNNDTNLTTDVFLRDRQSGKTTRVSVDSTGAQANGMSHPPSISGDGRYVAFFSDATNLVANDTNGVTDVFMRGPYLTLDVNPQAPAAGAPLAFTSWTGASHGLVLLTVTNINGTRMFLSVFTSSFDATGLWSFSTTTPTGLSGIDIGFTAFGVQPNGKVGISNEFDVAFQ